MVRVAATVIVTATLASLWILACGRRPAVQESDTRDRVETDGEFVSATNGRRQALDALNRIKSTDRAPLSRRPDVGSSARLRVHLRAWDGSRLPDAQVRWADMDGTILASASGSAPGVVTLDRRAGHPIEEIESMLIATHGGGESALAATCDVHANRDVYELTLCPSCTLELAFDGDLELDGLTGSQASAVSLFRFRGLRKVAEIRDAGSRVKFVDLEPGLYLAVVELAPGVIGASSLYVRPGRNTVTVKLPFGAGREVRVTCDDNLKRPDAAISVLAEWLGCNLDIGELPAPSSSTAMLRVDLHSADVLFWIEAHSRICRPSARELVEPGELGPIILPLKRQAMLSLEFDTSHAPQRPARLAWQVHEVALTVVQDPIASGSGATGSVTVPPGVPMEVRLEFLSGDWTVAQVRPLGLGTTRVIRPHVPDLAEFVVRVAPEQAHVDTLTLWLRRSTGSHRASESGWRKHGLRQGIRAMIPTGEIEWRVTVVGATLPLAQGKHPVRGTPLYLPLIETSTKHGRVVNGSGEPCVGRRVQALWANGLRIDAVTDATGRFSLPRYHGLPRSIFTERFDGSLARLQLTYAAFEEPFGLGVHTLGVGAVRLMLDSDDPRLGDGALVMLSEIRGSIPVRSADPPSRVTLVSSLRETEVILPSGSWAVRPSGASITFGTFFPEFEVRSGESVTVRLKCAPIGSLVYKGPGEPGVLVLTSDAMPDWSDRRAYPRGFQSPLVLPVPVGRIVAEWTSKDGSIVTSVYEVR